MKLISLVAAAIVALGAAGAATATTVDFDLRNPGGDVISDNSTRVIAMSGGVTLTITGQAFSGGINGTGWTGNPTAWSNGVGLSSYHGDNHRVDGYYDEYLALSFSEAVDLTSLTFAYANRSDNWRVLSGTFADFTFEDSGWLPSGNGWGSSVATVGVDSDAIGQFFLVGTTGNHSAWKLQGLSVDLAPVPLPASALLLLAGVGGLAALRRRQTAAA
ncbi:VPLPA-CTERM sorting domain-containing protein [Gymnodinialimonas sp. 2305UL16-5]|uniref:VPLPA-CTERM sorting domain-containing protein n=1 Tax=Gymnodinialimonas mytili TaxID=3126503 RepID=UPI00309EF986